MSKLKIGIIGCGGIANGKHMPAMSKQSDRAEMVAFCDIVKERAVKAAKEYGPADAKVYTDYKQLLEDKTIDVVHVCTPNRSHAEITVDALNAGKHVLCEKPMAKSVADAQLMLDAAKASGKKLTIGYQNRFNQNALAMKGYVDRGDLGEIYYAKAHAIRRRAVPTWGVFLNEFEQGGGPLIDIGTHALDLTLWMMDNYKPQTVLGRSFKKLGSQTQTANAWGDWDPKEFTVEDSAFGFITMENGAAVMLESSWAINYLAVGEAMTTLCGTKGGADMDGGLRINSVDLNRQIITKPDLNSGGVAFYEGEGNLSPQDMEAKCWIDCIIADTNPFVLPSQAFVVTQILESIYNSSNQNKAITF